MDNDFPVFILRSGALGRPHIVYIWHPQISYLAYIRDPNRCLPTSQPLPSTHQACCPVERAVLCATCDGEIHASGEAALHTRSELPSFQYAAQTLAPTRGPWTRFRTREFRFCDALSNAIFNTIFLIPAPSQGYSDLGLLGFRVRFSPEP